MTQSNHLENKQKCSECGAELNVMGLCQCGWVHPQTLLDHFEECCRIYQMSPDDPRLDQKDVKRLRDRAAEFEK